MQMTEESLRYGLSLLRDFSFFLYLLSFVLGYITTKKKKYYGIPIGIFFFATTILIWLAMILTGKTVLDLQLIIMSIGLMFCFLASLYSLTVGIFEYSNRNILEEKYSKEKPKDI